ncbi:transposase domain-containing protein [Streptomyces sp. O3]
MPRSGQTGKPAAFRLPERLAVAVLLKAFPPALVDEVVAECGCAERRRRLLPARRTLYFVLAMCLFSHLSYQQVADILGDGLDWARRAPAAKNRPTAAAICRARVRLGSRPLARLFALVHPAAARPARHLNRWRALSVDGAVFGIPGSPENRAWSAPSRPSASPQACVVALGESGGPEITRAELGPPLGANRPRLAALLTGLGRDDLLLADQETAGPELFSLAGTLGVDVVWRTEPRPALPVHAELPDGSYLSALARGTAEVRVVEGPLCRPTRLITTVLDPVAAPANRLIELHENRWRLRGSLAAFGALRGDASYVLRSRWPDGVEQELWGHLLVHRAVTPLLQPA